MTVIVLPPPLMCVCGHSWAEHRIDKVRKVCDHLTPDGRCQCPGFTPREETTVNATQNGPS